MTIPVKIDIWGSCVSRDIFGFGLPDSASDVPWAFTNPNISNYEINQYYAQGSFVSPFRDHYGPILQVTDFDDNLPNFVKKCIVSEFNGSTLNSYTNSGSEWLIIDFRSIIYGLVAIDYDGGGGLTDYVCNRNIDQIESILISKKVKHTVRLIENSEFNFDLYFDKFIEFIKNRYGRNIILIEARETESFFNRNGALSVSEDLSIQISTQYKYSLKFKRNTDCFLVRTPIDIFTDHLHRWGKDATVHYLSEYYAYAFDCIDAIISKRYENVHKYLETKFFEISSLMAEIRAGAYLSKNNTLKLILICIKNKEYDRSIKLCTKLIENGVSEGYAYMGRIYANGYGVKIDLSKASEYYYHALDLIWATNELFDVFWRMESHEKDNEMISLILPYTRSKKINGGAVARLGRAYRDGRGVEKDLKKAIQCMEKAIDLGVPWIRNDLFDIFWRLGDRKYDSEMIALYSDIAIDHDPNALGRLGRAYREGRGVNKDIDVARDYFSKASALDSRWSEEYNRML